MPAIPPPRHFFFFFFLSTSFLLSFQRVLLLFFDISFLGSLVKWRFFSPPLRVLSPFCGGFFVHFVWFFFFLLQVFYVLYLKPLTQIWTLGFFFFFRSNVCYSRFGLFCFLGSRSAVFLLRSEPCATLVWFLQQC